MEDSEMAPLAAALDRRLEETDTMHHRPLYAEIDWDDRLVCIKGAKGTGKTTMMLQYLKEHPDVADEIDALLRKQLSQAAVPALTEDDIPNAGGGDLSRRQRTYELKGLSFREFLEFEGVGRFEKHSLEEILKNHRVIAREIVSKAKVLKHFGKYLEGGYYPFYKSARGGYHERISQIVSQMLERDWPETEEVTLATVMKAKKMLMILAESCPQVPKMNELYAQLETDRNQGLKILYALERAGILSLLSSKSASLGNLSRPDKIYCDNTNIMHALTVGTNSGTVRETFFLNQLRCAGHKVSYPPQGDFLVDGRHLFEVGGRGKGFMQIKDVPDSYVVNDGVETGIGNKIPLWLFGFLY